ncbi:MAG: (Fe-S)-binding protein [Candidatus Helarchaeota archaeon]
MEELLKYKDDLYKCIHCRACRFAYSGEPNRKGIGEYKGVLYEGMLDGCPAGIEYGWEGYWNAGRMWIARAVIEGDLDINDPKTRQDIYDILYRCPTCGLCSMQCENNLPTVPINEALRATLVEAGVELLPKHKGLRDLIDEKNNPYNEEHSERTNWVTDKSKIDNPNAKIAYFVGCTAAYRMNDMARATEQILGKLHKKGFIPDFTILSDEVCCGSVIFRTGQWDVAKKVMKKNVETFNKYETVVFSCAGCYRTLKIDYEHFSEVEIKYTPKHVIELIAELMLIKCPECGKWNDPDAEYCGNDFCPKYSKRGGEPFPKEFHENKLKITKKWTKGPVTWHDPCHTIRHFCHYMKDKAIEEVTGEGDSNMWRIYVPSKFERERWIEMPRAIIRNIPGMELKEMYRIGENSLCCCAGGGVKAGYPEFALNGARRRLEEAEATGAEILMTACPFCELNMGQAANEFKMKFAGKVYDLLEVLNELID